ncbi:hypothetical protein DOTSEDRAFT_71077 [Dothistroma septosporum NZE10]|uniref:Uncharacterized protein n=1 Tax=Dothistroma septosporum (strain NZE10 / CBS 128990) TaxID=675120 RepID=N1PS48_DOTSN|nr:hypothetical protein DOTSEDRAFT_71077 [Dothistroma septosporum NZE10]
MQVFEARDVQGIPHRATCNGNVQSVSAPALQSPLPKQTQMNVSSTARAATPVSTNKTPLSPTKPSSTGRLFRGRTLTLLQDSSAIVATTNI